MLNLVISVTEESSESIAFLRALKDKGVHSVHDIVLPVADIIIVADRTFQYEERRRIYESHYQIIAPHTEIFYLFPGGTRFQNAIVIPEHNNFYQVGVFEDNFWRCAAEEVIRFIEETREHKLKML